ncbi:hypothetical protein ACFV9E_09765 [Streptomyces sp. NPDC059835]|uniref:hypothetical protein n=1 Tax=Streptomyces sp. NPDC059835 TaxID=3346967 RepID=UPI003653186A
MSNSFVRISAPAGLVFSAALLVIAAPTAPVESTATLAGGNQEVSYSLPAAPGAPELDLGWGR